MIINVNSGTGEKCAFCKHWYDPSNTAISPKNPSIGLWYCDDKKVSKCLIKNMNKRACASCNKFISKL